MYRSWIRSGTGDGDEKWGMGNVSWVRDTSGEIILGHRGSESGWEGGREAKLKGK